MKLATLLFCSLVAVSVFAASAAALLGGWSPIGNVNDPDVQRIAHFAVTEHNRLTGNNLRYVRVVSGESQVVAGMNYRLLILVTPAYRRGPTEKYVATVYERAWENYIELKSFVRSN